MFQIVQSKGIVRNIKDINSIPFIRMNNDDILSFTKVSNCINFSFNNVR